MKLLDRKMEHVQKTKAPTVATANPGCAVQLMQGGRRAGVDISVVHPVSLLAEAYRAEEDGR